MNYKYINGRLMGLPAPIKPRRAICKRQTLGPYIHKVKIKEYQYYKVHVKRRDISSIKYFKTLQEAQNHVDSLREKINVQY